MDSGWPMDGMCELCRREAKLRQSHIVPRFVIQWLKDTALSGIRTNQNPNQRVQDGPKIYLLCDDCEQRFSSWEKPFREHIFLPLHHPEPVFSAINYGDWALKFAVSVSWRTLVWLQRQFTPENLSPHQLELAKHASETWRRFLLGELKDPAEYSQHLLPVDVIKTVHGHQISPFLNRYFLRTFQLDIVASSRSVHVYTKMCRLILFGRIQERHPGEWKGMQLRLRHGKLMPRDYRMPGGILVFMNATADEFGRGMDSLSPSQKKAIDTAFQKNIDAVPDSEAFRAMRSDALHSGRAAFSRPKGEHPGDP